MFYDVVNSLLQIQILSNIMATMLGAVLTGLDSEGMYRFFKECQEPFLKEFIYDYQKNCGVGDGVNSNGDDELDEQAVERMLRVLQ